MAVKQMVLCNECKKAFPRDENVWTKTEGNGIQVTGFTCPLCGKVYESFRTSEQSRYARKKVEELQKRVFKHPTVDRARKLMTAEKRLQRLMSTLNESPIWRRVRLKGVNCRMDGTVYYEGEGDELKWLGNGYSEEAWPKGEVVTNVGVVEVTGCDELQIENKKDEEHRVFSVGFKGAGNPLGELKEWIEI